MAHGGVGWRGVAFVLGAVGLRLVCAFAFSFRFTAAATAALALEACVSRCGSERCWLAMTVALAIHLALCRVSASWSSMAFLTLNGTL